METNTTSGMTNKMYNFEESKDSFLRQPIGNTQADNGLSYASKYTPFSMESESMSKAIKRSPSASSFSSSSAMSNNYQETANNFSSQNTASFNPSSVSSFPY